MLKPYVIALVVIGLSIVFLTFVFAKYQTKPTYLLTSLTQPNLDHMSQHITPRSQKNALPGSLLEGYTQEFGPSLVNRFVHTPKHIKSDREIYQDNTYSQVFGWGPSRKIHQPTPIMRRTFGDITIANASDPAQSNPEWSSYFDNTFNPNDRKPVFSHEQETEDNKEHINMLYQIHQLN